MTEEQLLIHRVLNAVPARSYAMNGLLSLLRIEVSREVPTAAVSCERRPVLRINPEFARERCGTDEHLFLLVMHELYHVLLGHTRLFPRATPAHNVAFDAVINSLLVLQFPERAYTSFFLDMYGGQTGIGRLLAPPLDPPIGDAALAALHRLLYTNGQTTSEEIFNVIVRAAASAEEVGMLLGSHGATGDTDSDEWGTAGGLDPALVEALRGIVEKWPPPAAPIRGRSLSGQLQSQSVAMTGVRRSVLAVTRQALLGAATKSASPSRHACGAVPAQIVLPDLRDRRGAVQRASAGRAPLLYQSTLSSPRGRDAGRACVYVDVSGSMDPYIEHLYAALSALRQHIQPTVALFSTQVVTIPLAGLVRGQRETTGGTLGDCVFEHALRQRQRRVLVVTDGYVGAVAPALAARVRASGLEVRLLLTPGGWRKDLAPLAARIDELPPVARA